MEQFLEHVDWRIELNRIGLEKERNKEFMDRLDEELDEQGVRKMAPKKKRVDIAALERDLRRKEMHPEKFHIDFEMEKVESLVLYDKFKDKVCRTRYWDERAFIEIGLLDDVRRALQRIEVWDFFSKRTPTFEGLTPEFLSILRIRRERSTHYPTSIQYRLGNQKFTNLTSDINLIFGAPEGPDGSLYTHNSHHHQNEFWKLIAETTTHPIRGYDSSNTRATSIRNPTLRYIQKMLNATICYRTEGRSINKDELYILWCIVENQRFDMAATFIETCGRAQSYPINSVGMGGLVTILALHHGLDLYAMEPFDNPDNDLDIDAMRSGGMLRKVGDTWCLRQNDGLPFPLIYPELTTIFGPHTNLTLDSQAHLKATRTFMANNRRAVAREGWVMPPQQRRVENEIREGREGRAQRNAEGGEDADVPNLAEKPTREWRIDEYEYNRLLLPQDKVESKLERVEHYTRDTHVTYRMIHRMERYHLNEYHYAISDDEEDEGNN